jgi:manganese oxidase
VCPAKAPRKSFDVVAVETRLPMLGSVSGRAFVPADEVDAVLAAEQAPTPLVLRAAIGDCVVVNLENRLPAGSARVSLHADGLAYDPLTSGGVEAGRNPSQVVGRGDTRPYTFFAHPEYGEGAALLRDGGDLASSGRSGLYGAVVIGPRGTTYRPSTGWQSVATDAKGNSWRDVALLLHDEDDAIGTHRMPYTTAVRGAVAVNYGRGDTAPIAQAYAGDPLRVHVLAPWSEQAQVFTFEGHRWPLEPGVSGSTRVESLAIGGLESITVIPDGGAGGQARLPGEYRWGDHREPYREAGLWGRFLVHDGCDGRVASVPPLDDRPTCPIDDSDRWLPWAIAGAALLALALGVVLEVRRPGRLLRRRPRDSTAAARVH